MGKSRPVGERKRIFSPEHRQKLSEAARRRTYRPTNEKNGSWKGDAVGYGGLHRWIGEILGKPSLCAHCGTTDAPIFDWANVSREYRRDHSDWIRLCRSCHTKYDEKGFRPTLELEFRGEKRTLVGWANHLGIRYMTLYARIYSYGLSVEEAFTRPVRKRTVLPRADR